MFSYFNNYLMLLIPYFTLFIQISLCFTISYEIYQLNSRKNLKNLKFKEFLSENFSCFVFVAHVVSLQCCNNVARKLREIQNLFNQFLFIFIFNYKMFFSLAFFLSVMIFFGIIRNYESSQLVSIVSSPERLSSSSS